MESVQSFSGRGALRTGAGLYLLSLVFALPVCASRPSAASSDEPVRRSAEALYVHGMTQEIADREIGASGIPELLRLLWDPTFDRRDNVVAFLAYLGDTDTVPDLLRFLEQQPFSTDNPEEDRALLLVPEALGRIAGRTGDASALETLLALTAGDSVRERGLVEMAIHGLTFSGTAAARTRLEDLALRRIVPAIGFDLSRTATASLEWLDRTKADETAAHGSAFRTSTSAVDPANAPVTPTDFDDSPVTHGLRIDYANHWNLASSYRMNDARLDEMLDIATELVGLQDFPTDVACCATLTRTLPGTIFGSWGDGLDIITEDAELTAVLTDTVARVKVVRQISWCGGGPTTNTIGCAYVGGYGMAVVRYEPAILEAVLWTHEFGHNLGLVHVQDGRYIMNGSVAGVGGLQSNECRKFHRPPQATAISPVAIGVCADEDGDGRHEVIDNCPEAGNADQTDDDADGAGDACDNCIVNYNPGQHDDDQDSLGDSCDNCRWAANLDQSDVDQDGIGDLCDNCLAQNNRDQADGDQDLVGNACDNCPLRFNPAQADFDGDAIGDLCEDGATLADADGSGKVDGFDLVRLGRAFGAAAGEPNYDVTVDLDRNGRVDGEDLAAFAGYFGDLVD